MRYQLLLVMVVGCAAEPPPDVEPLPSCAALGCRSLTVSDKGCASSGACACAVDRSAPAVACAADCADLPCDGLSCGYLTPAGDLDPTACTCTIGDTFASCRDGA